MRKILCAITLVVILSLLPLAGCGDGSSLSSSAGGPSLSESTTSASPTPVTDSDNVWHFVTAPDLQPMRVSVQTRLPGTAPGQVFITPYSVGTAVVGQAGALMLDDAGNPVFFHPTSDTDQVILNFAMQSYRGQNVLTWWQGSLNVSPTAFLPPGGAFPGARNYVYDQRYCQLLAISGQNGWTADVHEFLLTPQGTALFTVSRTVPMDLTPYGGPSDGSVQDSGIQEIDLTTGKVIFQWSILDHVPLTESEQPAPSSSSMSWDAYHINAIDQDDQGHLLVSVRNTWTVYQVSHATGAIDWKLGGKASSFVLDDAARFFWQHHARYQPGNRISMYDDGCCNIQPLGPAEQPSHALVLELDLAGFTASAVRQYFHDPTISADTQGDAQTLPNSNMFVGWGDAQYYSEFTANGTLLYDVQIPASNVSYRTYRFTWVGTPAWPPSVAARSTAQGCTVYASWNGATEVAQWQVLAGPDSSSLLSVGQPVPRTGFETAIPLTTRASCFEVQAFDKAGALLGTSPIVVLDGAPSTSAGCPHPDATRGILPQR